jgi:hypothetical protein
MYGKNVRRNIKAGGEEEALHQWYQKNEALKNA